MRDNDNSDGFRVASHEVIGSRKVRAELGSPSWSKLGFDQFGE